MHAAGFWSLVPVEPQPSQTIKDAGHHLGRRTLRVSIFDAENESSAVAPGEQPVEQRRSRTPHVQITCGRGSEANARRGHGRPSTTDQRAATASRVSEADSDARAA